MRSTVTLLLIALAGLALACQVATGEGVEEKVDEEVPYEMEKSVGQPSPHMSVRRHRGHRHAEASPALVSQDEAHVRGDVHLIIDNVCKNVTHAEMAEDAYMLCRQDLLGKFADSLDILISAHRIDKKLIDQLGVDAYMLWRVNGHDYNKLLSTILHGIHAP